MTEPHLSPEDLVEYLHGELPAERDATAHRHLADCAACRDAYESEARLTELLRAHARAEERDLPPAVVAGVRAALERERPAQRFAGWLRPALVAAAIVCGLLVGMYASQGGWHSRARAAGIDASYYLDDHAALDRTTPLGEDAALPAALTSNATHSDDRALANAR